MTIQCSLLTTDRNLAINAVIGTLLLAIATFFFHVANEGINELSTATYSFTLILVTTVFSMMVALLCVVLVLKIVTKGMWS